MTHALDPGGDVHLWTAAVSELEDPEHYASSWSVLSTSEQRHAGRFRFEQDRNSFLASRALRRHVLSCYAAVEPKQWQFADSEYGRPRIAFPVLDEMLEFNCSKSADLVICAVTRGISVGVDIERLDRKVPGPVAESTFAAIELAAIEALPRNDQGKRFFAYWTLKEAYLKARGLGLSVPLDSMAFTVTDSPGLVGHMEFSAANDCSEWQFTLLSPSPLHIAAVCVRRQYDLEAHVEIHRYSQQLNLLKARAPSW